MLRHKPLDKVVNGPFSCGLIFGQCAQLWSSLQGSALKRNLSDVTLGLTVKHESFMHQVNRVS